jgi:hypothetical protein
MRLSDSCPDYYELRKEETGTAKERDYLGTPPDSFSYIFA